jgi:hypothetical protein
MSSSILTSYRRSGHSADVKMHLRIGDRTFVVGQLGPDFLILEPPFDHPATDGVLFFSIDGHERLRTIHLPDGISASSSRVAIRLADPK